MTDTAADAFQDAADADHQERAAGFAALHAADAVLVLPNAWDVASARIVEDAGAAAIATTSAGVAWALGAADGNRLDRTLALQAVARIAAAVGVPVTADIETGFGATDEELAETIAGVLASGAVGINIEDAGEAGLRPMEGQAARLVVVRESAAASGGALFVNARTDVYLRGVGEPEGRLAEVIRRSEAYLAAGADGIFVPGVLDMEILRHIVEAIPAPVNVLAGPGGPSVAQLADIGVRRISVGSSIAQAAYSVVRRAAVELLSAGSYGALDGDMDYAELNRVVDAHP